jgi:hypothetical protein
VGSALERSIDLIASLWGLKAPPDCRVYVMTSWSRFLFHAAPWPWRIYLAITLPLRYPHIQRVWALAGGWALRYGERRVIGIKPPELRQESDTELGRRLWIDRNAEEWVEHNTCHELTHACSDDLRLPNWLHEGLAMVTVDRFADRPTVREETLQVIVDCPGRSRPAERFGRRAADPDALLYLAVRSYWITRYLAEGQPELLREQLAQPQDHKALEGRLAAGLGLGMDDFWREIDGMLGAHYAARTDA